MPQQITKRFEFDYGHRVMGHGGKCKHLHGHRGVAEVTVRAPRLDELGMVVDFSLLKELVGGWIDANLDHNLLLNPRDPILSHLNGGEERKPYLMRNGNPTAENIAEEVFHVAHGLLGPRGLEVTGVRVWETPTCWADYSPGE